MLRREDVVKPATVRVFSVIRGCAATVLCVPVSYLYLTVVVSEVQGVGWGSVSEALEDKHAKCLVLLTTGAYGFVRPLTWGRGGYCCEARAPSVMMARPPDGGGPSITCSGVRVCYQLAACGSAASGPLPTGDPCRWCLVADRWGSP